MSVFCLNSKTIWKQVSHLPSNVFLELPYAAAFLSQLTWNIDVLLANSFSVSLQSGQNRQNQFLDVKVDSLHSTAMDQSSTLEIPFSIFQPFLSREESRNAPNFSCRFFPWLSNCLVAEYLWLFPRVLVKLILTVFIVYSLLLLLYRNMPFSPMSLFLYFLNHDFFSFFGHIYNDCFDVFVEWHIWAFSQAVSVAFLFSCARIILSCFFAYLIILLLKTGHFR